MRRVETGNPDCLEYREPLGVRTALFGYVIICLVAFVLCAAGLFWNRPTDLSDLLHTLAIIAILDFGGVFLLLVPTALSKLFTRLRVRIDRRTRTVERRWGWIIPVGWGKKSLDRYQQLRIDFEPSGIFGRPWRYHLYMINPAGDRLRIGLAATRMPLLAMAERVGTFIGLEVLDAKGTA